LVRTTAAITRRGDRGADGGGRRAAGRCGAGDAGAGTRASILRANGETGIGLGIIRQANGNTLAISAAVRAVVAEMQPLLPPDVRMFVTSDSADFIEGAIHEVEIALGLSVLIVTAVIYVFLRDARATLIPAIAMPVALIGTLAAIWLVGFSVNILTLLALVLATGMVVDDAIVVLENIVRRRSEGMGARAAAVLGTQQVFFAVLTTTATLAAVFMPLSFLPGQTGGAVPRIRLHAGHRGAAVVGRGADAVPGAGQPHAAGRGYARPGRRSAGWATGWRGPTPRTLRAWLAARWWSCGGGAVRRHGHRHDGGGVRRN
jgi:hydrophobic/amphiphilic exporter-1 (mainly G- bacteria), HAE1 family